MHDIIHYCDISSVQKIHHSSISPFSQPDPPPKSISPVSTSTIPSRLPRMAKSLKANVAGPDLRFDGRVVVVTGAGQGLGESSVLQLLSTILVRHSGAGAGSSSADTIINELRALGAKAIANCDSVVDGDEVIETAMKAFRRVDIIIKNAGILRDKSFAIASQWSKITDFEDGRATYPTTAGESFMGGQANFEN
ncbi:hypothetical protein HDU80_002883, partial [Chytriomyces hyalinus]